MLPSSGPPETVETVRKPASSLVRKIVVRLTVTTLTIAAIILGLLTYGLYLAEDSLRDRSLSNQASDLAKYVSFDAGGHATINIPASLTRLYEQESHKSFFAIIGADNTLLLASGGLTKPIFSGELKTDSTLPHFFKSLVRDDTLPVYGVVLPVQNDGNWFSVQVAQDASHKDVLVDAIIEEFFERMGWVIVLFLGILLGINVFTIRNALKPLRWVSRRAASIGPSAIDIRLSDANIPREIVPLIVAFNDVLDRLEKGFRLQQEFTSDAAHQLRTPLAILTARIDEFDRTEHWDAGRLKADARAMSRIVAQLLRSAQLESLNLRADERADLSAVCLEVATFMAPMAIAEKKSITLVGAEQPVICHGRAEAVYHAVMNLTENALVHTPPGTEVEIRVAEPPSISVRDRGPGIPAAFKERVFDRHWRADRKGTGAGLGLAIVSKIARIHGGTVRIEDASTDADGHGGVILTMDFLPPLAEFPDPFEK